MRSGLLANSRVAGSIQKVRAHVVNRVSKILIGDSPKLPDPQPLRIRKATETELHSKPVEDVEATSAATFIRTRIYFLIVLLENNLERGRPKL